MAVPDDPAKNLIHLTVITDPTHLKWKLTKTSLTLTSESSLCLTFYSSIDTSSSHHRVTGTGVVYTLQKEHQGEPFWPRLLATTQKHHFIRTDFDRWVDQEEQAQEEEEEEDKAHAEKNQKDGGRNNLAEMQRALRAPEVTMEELSRVSGEEGSEDSESDSDA